MNSAVERRTIIVFFHPGHPNYVGMLKYVQPALALHGYSFEEISFREPSALTRLATLLLERSDEIFCLYSINFYIKELALQNLWLAAHEGVDRSDRDELYLHQLTGIPLVVHIYDHPLYLLNHASSAFDRAIVFVNGNDIIDFMQKHFSRTCTYVPIPIPTEISMPALIPSLRAPSLDDFLARRNEVWCPMNLSVQNLTVDGHWARIGELPTARRERAVRLVEAALYDCETPLHSVSERLDAEGDPEIELADQLHVANFIKLWRRTELIRKLIRLPILVSSDFIPADLARRYPRKFIRTSMAETLTFYGQFRFSLNSFPLHNEALHDRVINPFLANSVLITDRNALATRLFEDGIDVIFLNYNSDDMAAKVERYLQDSLLAFSITVNRYKCRLEQERHRATGAVGNLCDELIEAVKQRWLTRPRSRDDVAPGI
jgi:hypothetical protein